MAMMPTKGKTMNRNVRIIIDMLTDGDGLHTSDIDALRDALADVATIAASHEVGDRMMECSQAEITGHAYGQVYDSARAQDVADELLESDESGLLEISFSPRKY